VHCVEYFVTMGNFRVNAAATADDDDDIVYSCRLHGELKDHAEKRET
jgi:hypothetical protein